MHSILSIIFFDYEPHFAVAERSLGVEVLIDFAVASLKDTGSCFWFLVTEDVGFERYSTAACSREIIASRLSKSLCVGGISNLKTRYHRRYIKRIEYIILLRTKFIHNMIMIGARCTTFDNCCR